MKKYNMLTDSPGKSLFFFALPMILGNLFQQFYSTVDSIIVGQYVGEDALAAVGASYSLTTVFIMGRHRRFRCDFPVPWGGAEPADENLCLYGAFELPWSEYCAGSCGACFQQKYSDCA